MEEIWKDIVGYEGLYQVSNNGKVRSLPRIVVYNDGTIHPYNGKELSQNTVHGYKYIILSKEGDTKPFRVHRLVAIAFIENPLMKSDVNHKNKIRHDNTVENLEWATRSENEKHSYLNGKKANRNCKLKNNQVQIIREALNNGHSQYKIANYFKVSRSAILSIKHNITWK